MERRLLLEEEMGQGPDIFPYSKRQDQADLSTSFTANEERARPGKGFLSDGLLCRGRSIYFVVVSLHSGFRIPRN